MAILLKPRADRLLKPQRWEVQPAFSDNPEFWDRCVAFAMPNGETTQGAVPNLAGTKYTFQAYSNASTPVVLDGGGPAHGYNISSRNSEGMQIAETDFVDTYLTGASEFTMGVWFKYPTSNTSGADALIGAWSARDGSTSREKKAYLIEFNGTYYFGCRNAADTAEVNATYAITKAKLYQWSLAVATFNSGAMRLYHNGEVVATNSLGSSTINGDADSIRFEMVGSHFTTVSNTWSPRFYHGYSFFHSRVLSDAEIARLAADPFGPVRERRREYFVPAGGGGTVSGTGTAAGASTATAAGASTHEATGASAGAGAAAGVGAATAGAAGSAAGTATATAVGKGTTATTGAAAGTGAASGVGASTHVATGSAAGVGAASGVGAATAAATGTAAGTSTATAVAAGQAVGTAAGTSTATAVGAATAAATGTAAGSSTVLGVSFVPAAEVEAIQGGWGHRHGDEWDVRSEDDRRRTIDEARREAVRRAFVALDPEVRPGPVPKRIERRIAAKAKEIAPEVDLNRAKATLAALRVQIDAVWQERQAELARKRDDEEALIALLMAA